LLKPSVWANAAIQKLVIFSWFKNVIIIFSFSSFNSIGVAFGGLIAMSSYKKRSDKILRYDRCGCLRLLNLEYFS
jgi:hypothetical protein